MRLGTFKIWKIWASTEKKFGPIMSSFWGQFFLCFHGQQIDLKYVWKYFSVGTKKFHRKYFFKKMGKNIISHQAAVESKNKNPPNKTLLATTVIRTILIRKVSNHCKLKQNGCRNFTSKVQNIKCLYSFDWSSAINEWLIIVLPEF